MLEAGLVIFRSLHYSAVLALFGVALSPLYLRELGAAASPVLSILRSFRIDTAQDSLPHLRRTSAWGSASC